MGSEYSKAYRSSMLWLPKREVVGIEYVKRALTLVPNFDNLKPIKLYREDGELFGVPRNTSLSVKEIIDQTTLGGRCSISFTKELRVHQEPIIATFRRKFELGKTDFLLEASTGFGKTVLLLKALSIIDRPCLVIVPKSDLVEQWRERILQFTNLSSSDIGLARQSVCDFQGKKIVLGMIQSLYKDKYPDEFKHHFGVLIVDEVHKVGAAQFSKVAGMFPARYRIAATATLKRQDGMEQVVIAHFGQERLMAVGGTQPVPKVVVAKYAGKIPRPPHWLKTMIQRRGRIISSLAESKHRSYTIAGLVADLVASGRQTAVLSERIPQLDVIKAALLQKGVPESEIGVYIGATPKSERQRMVSECKVLLATTKMLDLGTDIPTLRAMVFATPLANIEQPVGRIRRICEGAKEPVVIDILDTEVPEATRWFDGRAKFYRRIGAEMVVRTVWEGK